MADLSLIKKLRQATGCGISDCNKALKENNDNFDDSIAWLRKKGLSSAAKKAGRIAAEGVVAVAVTKNGTKAAIIEVNSETDFVARNQQFQEFVKNTANLALEKQTTLDQLNNATFPGKSHDVAEELKNAISVIGENINIRRVEYLNVNQGVVASYIHNIVIDNLGKIAVLVALESSANQEKLEELGKKIAMHIAATKPESLDIASLDPKKLETEKEILKDQARASGKPENIIEKMIEGRIRKYYQEVVLLEQNFVMDDKLQVKDIVAQTAKELNTDIKVTGFKLFVLGQGIEKKEDDFASEVAAMSK